MSGVSSALANRINDWRAANLTRRPIRFHHPDPQETLVNSCHEAGWERAVYGLSRQPERARQVLQQLEEVARHQHVSGYYFSQVYLALGETEPALDWLERPAEERSPLIVYVKVAPQFDKLRAEPRFHALLRRIGLEH